MKYLIRQKIFAFGDNFVIKNEFDQDAFVVRGKVFSIGDKLRIYDMAGNERYYIEQRVFRFLPEYYLYSNGQQVACIKREMSFFKPKLNIQSVYGNFEVVGNFVGMNFDILRNNMLAASISKKWISFSDSYQVDISDNEDHAFILTLAIILDQIFHDNNHNNG